MAKLHLTIVTQDRTLLDEEVDSVTAPASEGEVTILPNHVPLLTTLKTGELIYRTGNQDHSVVITSGFMDMGPDNVIKVMVDSATRSDEIDLRKAETAKEEAERLMKESQDRRNFLLAEAQLRKALIEIQVYKRKGKGGANAPRVG